MKENKFKNIKELYEKYEKSISEIKKEKEKLKQKQNNSTETSMIQIEIDKIEKDIEDYTNQLFPMLEKAEQDDDEELQDLQQQLSKKSDDQSDLENSNIRKEIFYKNSVYLDELLKYDEIEYKLKLTEDNSTDSSNSLDDLESIDNSDSFDSIDSDIIDRSVELKHKKNDSLRKLRKIINHQRLLERINANNELYEFVYFFIFEDPAFYDERKITRFICKNGLYRYYVDEHTDINGEYKSDCEQLKILIKEIEQSQNGDSEEQIMAQISDIQNKLAIRLKPVLLDILLLKHSYEVDDEKKQDQQAFSQIVQQNFEITQSIDATVSERQQAQKMFDAIERSRDGRISYGDYKKHMDLTKILERKLEMVRESHFKSDLEKRIEIIKEQIRYDLSMIYEVFLVRDGQDKLELSLKTDEPENAEETQKYIDLFFQNEFYLAPLLSYFEKISQSDSLFDDEQKEESDRKAFSELEHLYYIFKRQDEIKPHKFGDQVSEFIFLMSNDVNIMSPYEIEQRRQYKNDIDLSKIDLVDYNIAQSEFMQKKADLQRELYELQKVRQYIENSDEETSTEDQDTIREINERIQKLKNSIQDSKDSMIGHAMTIVEKINEQYESWDEKSQIADKMKSVIEKNEKLKEHLKGQYVLSSIKEAYEIYEKCQEQIEKIPQNSSYEIQEMAVKSLKEKLFSKEDRILYALSNYIYSNVNTRQIAFSINKKHEHVIDIFSKQGNDLTDEQNDEKDKYNSIASAYMEPEFINFMNNVNEIKRLRKEPENKNLTTGDVDIKNLTMIELETQVNNFVKQIIRMKPVYEKQFKKIMDIFTSDSKKRNAKKEKYELLLQCNHNDDYNEFLENIENLKSLKMQNASPDTQKPQFKNIETIEIEKQLTPYIDYLIKAEEEQLQNFDQFIESINKDDEELPFDKFENKKKTIRLIENDGQCRQFLHEYQLLLYKTEKLKKHEDPQNKLGDTKKSLEKSLRNLKECTLKKIDLGRSEYLINEIDQLKHILTTSENQLSDNQKTDKKSYLWAIENSKQCKKHMKQFIDNQEEITGMGQDDEDEENQEKVKKLNLINEFELEDISKCIRDILDDVKMEEKENQNKEKQILEQFGIFWSVDDSSKNSTLRSKLNKLIKSESQMVDFHNEHINYVSDYYMFKKSIKENRPIDDFEKKAFPILKQNAKMFNKKMVDFFKKTDVWSDLKLFLERQIAKKNKPV